LGRLQGSGEEANRATHTELVHQKRISLFWTTRNIADFIEELLGEFTAPAVKQHLAALRMLFDWLVTGHVLEVNPAHAVRGPKYVVKKGKGIDGRQGARAARQLCHRQKHDLRRQRGDG